MVDRYGRLDVLVANVGQNKARPVEETTDEDWRRFVNINLSSAFYGVRAALPPMLEKGRGKILLIGSSAAFDGGGGAVDYAAAKAGLTGMMRYLARSYARQGILANVIHPGVIETDLLRERYSHPDKKQTRSSPKSPSAASVGPRTLPAWPRSWPARGATSSVDRNSWSTEAGRSSGQRDPREWPP